MNMPKYPKCKDSGVKWMGVIPQHWGVSPLKYLFRIVGGSTPKSDVEAYWDGEILWATPSDLGNLKGFCLGTTQRKITERGLASCSSSLVPEGSIVLSTRAPIGSVAISGKELCTNQGCKSLVLTSKGNVFFFAHLLSVVTHELNIKGKGTTFTELSGEELASFKVPVPSPAEQNILAQFLESETATIDALILKQQRLIDLLMEKREGVIFNSVTRGLNPKAPMKPSNVDWLGDVPAHWDVYRLATLYTEINEPGSADLPFLTVSIHDGVSDRQLGSDEVDRKVNRSEDASKYKRVAPGDLVYNMMRAWQGGFGTVTVPGQISPAYVVARPKRNFSSRFIELLLRTPQAVEEIRCRSYGVADFRLRLYWENFKNIRVALPPESEQAEILAHIEGIDKKYNSLIEAATVSIEKLQERRSALISAAVTGKIDVRGLTPSEAA